MIINGKNYVFHLNIRATKRIAALCPGRDLTNIDKVFDTSGDFVNVIDTMSEIAIAMSLNSENETPLTMEDIESLDFAQFTNLVDELKAQFGMDRQTNVTTQPAKKKPEVNQPG